MSRITTFRITDGVVTAPEAVPRSLTQIAIDAYAAVRGSPRCSPSQVRVEELISACLTVYEKSRGDDPTVAAGYRDFDHEAEKINDVLCMCPDGRFYWQDVLSDADELAPYQLVASYALYMADQAATHWLAGRHADAFEALSSACHATADYGFHWGYDDRTGVIGGDGEFHAMTSPRLLALRAGKEHVVARWEAGPTGTGDRWPSAAAFARAVKEETMQLVKDRGWTLIGDNAIRTIQDWVREAKKRRQDGAVNRPGFTRHLRAVHYGRDGGGYEWQAVLG